MLTLAEVVEALTGTRPERAAHVITDAVVDSRQAIPGALFVALPGKRLDGHDFLDDAFARGASFALIQRDVPETYPVLDLRSSWPSNEAATIRPPLCLRVDNSLKALQEIV